MAIINSKGETKYVGQVIGSYEHMWSDGMLEEYAIVWRTDTHETEHITVGYYGSDGRNMCGSSYKIDFTDAIVDDVIATMKRNGAEAFIKKTEADKHTVLKGDRVKVVRGRKIPKGTELTVFWIGDRPTYTGYGTETIAGCRDANGKKVWIKRDYLETLEIRPDPTEQERAAYIREYVESGVRSIFGNKVKISL